MDGIIKDELRNKVWMEKYKAPEESSPEETFKRVAQAIWEWIILIPTKQ
jgi:hypothetical protein